MAPRASSLFGRRDVGFETLPFGIAEIGRVAPFHGSERKSSTSPSLFQTVSPRTPVNTAPPLCGTRYKAICQEMRCHHERRSFSAAAERLWHPTTPLKL